MFYINIILLQELIRLAGCYSYFYYWNASSRQSCCAAATAPSQHVAVAVAGAAAAQGVGAWQATAVVTTITQRPHFAVF